ncbi:MAG TPA: lasso peptide biosynthesis B2 protein [Candidatus Angelobacter sp.]|jgi:hypothetical protein
MSTSHAATILRPSISVREIETPDGAALLDIKRGLCLTINAVGVMIWKHLKAGRAPNQIVECLSTEFPEVPMTRLSADITDFVEQLKRKHLLLPEHRLPWQKQEHLPKLLTFIHSRQHLPSPLRSPHGKPRCLLLKALCGLLIFDLLQCGRSFAKIHACVHAWPVAKRLMWSDMGEQVSEAVNYACVWYPKRTLCLQRSAVATCLLRQYGLPAELVIAAQKFPFKAHAWTELGGKVINERKDVQRAYLVWDRC